MLVLRLERRLLFLERESLLVLLVQLLPETDDLLLLAVARFLQALQLRGGRARPRRFHLGGLVGERGLQLGDAGLQIGDGRTAEKHLVLAGGLLLQDLGHRRLGLERLSRGERDDPFAFEPLYLRPSSAEEKWRGR